MLTDPVEVPDVKVHHFEDRYVTEAAKVRPSPEALARRPGYGTAGRSIVVRANFFPMDFRPGVKFHSYRLKTKPETNKKGQQKFIMQSTLRKYHLLTKVGYATDGVTEIVTTELLPTNPKPYTCSMNENGKDHSGKSNVYTGPWDVTLELDSSYSPEEMIACLRDHHHREELEKEAPCLRVLNILMSAYAFKDAGTSIIGKGRNKFFRMDRRKQSIDMKGGIEAVRGYYSSVRLGAGRIMLNLNVSHSAFYRPGLMTNLVHQFADLHGQDRELLHRYVKGIKVYALHLESRENGAGEMEKPIKSILGLATPRDGRGHKSEESGHPPEVLRVGSSANNVRFWMEKDGKKGYISVAEYFRKGMSAVYQSLSVV